MKKSLLTDQSFFNLKRMFSRKDAPTVKPPLVVGTLASTGWSVWFPTNNLRGREGTRLPSLKYSA